MSYAERRAVLLPATMWTSRSGPGERAIIPDGSMDLIWDGSRMMVAGPDRRPYRHLCTGWQRFTAVRFDPGVAPVALGIPAGELLDSRVDLADLWGERRARAFTEQLDPAPHPTRTLEAAAARLLTDRRQVGWALAVTRAVRAGVSIDRIAAECALAPRQLLRRSTHAFGYGPKQLQRILRVQTAAELIRAGAALSSVAAQAGFADYSHLYREVRAVAGHRPADFRPA